MDEDSDNQLVSGTDVEAMKEENETEENDNKKEVSCSKINLKFQLPGFVFLTKCLFILTWP